MKPPSSESQFLLRGICFGVLFGVTTAVLVGFGSGVPIDAAALLCVVVSIGSSIAMVAMTSKVSGAPMTPASAVTGIWRESKKARLVPFEVVLIIGSVTAALAGGALESASIVVAGMCLLAIYVVAYQRSRN